MKSSPLPLPPDVRAATEDILGHDGIREEFAWMSWAGTVWKLTGERGTLFIKRAAHLEGERARLVWLDGRWPVPRMAGFFHELGDDWLLTHPVPGVPMSEKSLGWEPDRVAVTLGAILRRLHATDAVGCPFGVAKPANVLVHGDYCLPNVLVEDGKLSGLVDVGLSGLGNPETDLAAGLWTLNYNYGPGFARPFLDAYGWPPMSDASIEKLRRKYSR